MTRVEILESARKCVCGDREQDYGSPEHSFAKIAELWSAYCSIAFSAKDVAVMMALMKIARIRTGHGKEDNWVDGCGYLACGGEIESGGANE